MQEPCHKLAWILDACCKDQVLDERRLKELSAFFAPYQQARQHKHHKRPREWESVSKANSDSDDPQKALAEAGMILREPCTLHLIIHQASLLTLHLHHADPRLLSLVIADCADFRLSKASIM